MWAKERNRVYQREWKARNKDKVKAWAKRYYLAHKERELQRNRLVYEEKKIEVLAHYSGVNFPSCSKCGFSDIRALSIDHINRRNGDDKSGNKLYRWLIKEDFPEGYQTLCMNCQFIKRTVEGEWRNGRGR